MKTLSSLLSGVKTIQKINFQDITIKDIQFDSRKVTLGSLFVASKGTQFDGHDFIQQAIQNGASVIVCEEIQKKFSDQTIIIVKNQQLLWD